MLIILNRLILREFIEIKARESLADRVDKMNIALETCCIFILYIRSNAYIAFQNSDARIVIVIYDKQ